MIHPFESSFSAMCISLGGCWSQTWTRGRLGQRHSQARRAKGKKLSPATHKPKSKSYGQKDLNSTHESWLQTTTVSLKLASLGCPAEEKRQGLTGVTSNQNVSGGCSELITDTRAPTTSPGEGTIKFALDTCVVSGPNYLAQGMASLWKRNL